MTSELKPCPFCGGDAEITEYHTGNFEVQCSNETCGVQPNSVLDNKETVINDWNTRAVPDVPELEALKKYTVISPFAPIGEYILHSEAAEAKLAIALETEKDAKQSRDDWKKLAKDQQAELAQYEAQVPFSYLEASLLVDQAFKTWAEKPHNHKWVKRIDGTPIPNDLCSVISVRVAGLYASPSPAADLKAENERLREALTKISSPTQTAGLLWWQVEARAALNVEASNEPVINR